MSNMPADAESYLHVELGVDGPTLKGSLTKRLGQVLLPQSLRTNQDIFGEWHWDGNQVTVRNCKFGFFPLFYYAAENRFGVAPSVERLLECGAPTDLDDAALSTFLRLGFVVGEETVFRHIRMVPPGGEVRWSGGKPKISGGYIFPRRQNLSRQAAIDGYGELFRQAVQRRASKGVKFGLPLSGGRDSRHILLELNALGIRPEVCFTNHDFPPYRTENIRIAGLLASRLNIPHRVLGQSGSEMRAEIRKNRINSYRAIEDTWAVNLYPEVARYTPIVYEGTGGDVSAGLYLYRKHVELLEKDRIEELADQILTHWLTWKASEDALARILSKDAARRFSKEIAVEHLAKELNRHMSAPSPLLSFYFWNRERGVNAPQAFAIAREAGVAAVTPYMDHDVVNFLASLPEDMYMDKAFHTETIHRMHPAFREIPFAGADTPLIEKNWHYRRLLLEIGAYLFLNGKNQLVEKEQTVRRLLALALKTGVNVRQRARWIAPYTVLYLTQLENLSSRA